MDRKYLKKITAALCEYESYTEDHDEIFTNYWNSVRENDDEELKWFEGFGSNVSQRIMNVNEFKHSLIFGVMEVQFDSSNWIIPYKFPHVEVFLIEDENKPWINSLKLGKGDKGKWAYGYNISHGLAGGGCPIHVFGKAFDNKEDCIKDGLLFFKAEFEKAVKMNDPVNFKMPYCKNVLSKINELLKEDHSITTNKKGQMLLFNN